MYSIEVVILVGIAALVIGGLIGLVAGRSWIPPVQQKELEHRLASSKAEMDEYQTNVAQHFMETSKRVSDLTQSYRDLHEHLSKGALELTSTEIGRRVIEAGDEPNVAHLEKTELEAPKDWAPRTPGTHGMLSEEFGLREQEPRPTGQAPKSGP